MFEMNFVLYDFYKENSVTNGWISGFVVGLICTQNYKTFLRIENFWNLKYL